MRSRADYRRTLAKVTIFSGLTDADLRRVTVAKSPPAKKKTFGPTDHSDGFSSGAHGQQPPSPHMWPGSLTRISRCAFQPTLRKLFVAQPLRRLLGCRLGTRAETCGCSGSRSMRRLESRDGRLKNLRHKATRKVPREMQAKRKCDG